MKVQTGFPVYCSTQVILWVFFVASMIFMNALEIQTRRKIQRIRGDIKSLTAAMDRWAVHHRTLMQRNMWGPS